MELSKELLSANWGIEREVLRVDEKGRLATTPHPFSPEHEQITVDYAEAQAELITRVHPGPFAALEELQQLQESLEARLGNELLWPLSLPGAWTQGQSVAPASFGGHPDWEAQRSYRRTLEEKHGGARQVLSGVHVNYSFGPGHPGGDYFALARNFLRYQPILTWLLSASPWLDKAYQTDLSHQRSMAAVSGAERCGPWTSSVRQGALGYSLAEDLEEALDVRYDSLEEYLLKLQGALATKEGQKPLLSHEREFYAWVRPKGRALERTGVEYLEFRSFDLDPLAPFGIRRETLLFLELFLAVLTALPSPLWRPEDLRQRRSINKALAQCTLGRRPGAPGAVRALWEGLEPSLRQLAAMAGDEHQRVLGGLRDQVEGKTLRTIDRIALAWESSGPLAWGLRRAQLHRAWGQLELSTRLVIEEADRRGLGVELLDATDNFVALEKAGVVEYVKQATRTSADPYVAALVMENKEVTKKVLRRHGLKVPEGAAFGDQAAARKASVAWRHLKMVVKPNATNFGDGVTILEPHSPDEAWEAALELAFSLDKQVLIESFAPGLEFRFLVIGGETRAILHRIPANVTGDDIHTIAQLVERKNRHPWRGEGYRKPLEKLKLDTVEQEFLAAQGLSSASVPVLGQRVFLRKNSNISTGGDSLDFTDTMPAVYRLLAEKAAAAVGASICGLDMILPDWKTGDPEAYTILELNFNPALHIHAYPAEGQNRHPEAAVLDLLFDPQNSIKFPENEASHRLRSTAQAR